MTSAMDDGDPFTGRAPGRREVGRIETTGRIEPGWPCRRCANRLRVDPRGFVVCLLCDSL